MAQNIVLLKAQYGVDSNGDNLVDCWTPADNSGTCTIAGAAVDFTGPTDPTTLAGGAGSFSRNRQRSSTARDQGRPHRDRRPQ